MATAKEIAKALVGQWGFEEPYWWEPIEEALKEAYVRGRHDAYTFAAYNAETVDVGGLPNETA